MERIRGVRGRPRPQRRKHANSASRPARARRRRMRTGTSAHRQGAFDGTCRGGARTPSSAQAQARRTPHLLRPAPRDAACGRGRPRTGKGLSMERVGGVRGRPRPHRRKRAELRISSGPRLATPHADGDVRAPARGFRWNVSGGCADALVRTGARSPNSASPPDPRPTTPHADGDVRAPARGFRWNVSGGCADALVRTGATRARRRRRTPHLRGRPRPARAVRPAPATPHADGDVRAPARGFRWNVSGGCAAPSSAQAQARRTPHLVRPAHDAACGRGRPRTGKGPNVSARTPSSAQARGRRTPRPSGPRPTTPHADGDVRAPARGFRWNVSGGCADALVRTGARSPNSASPPARASTTPHADGDVRAPARGFRWNVSGGCADALVRTGARSPNSASRTPHLVRPAPDDAACGRGRPRTGKGLLMEHVGGVRGRPRPHRRAVAELRISSDPRLATPHADGDVRAPATRWRQ